MKIQTMRRRRLTPLLVRFPTFSVIVNQYSSVLGDREKSSKLQYLLTGEEISVNSKYMIALNRENKGAPLIEESSKQEKRRGYLQYVPDTIEKFTLYWKVAAGNAIIKQGSNAMYVASVKGGVGEIIPAKCIIR